MLRLGRVPNLSVWCSPIVSLPHACLPVRWWIRFHCGATIKYFRGCRPTGKATVVETIHRMVSKSHLSNPQPPSAKTEKGHSFWNVLLFWWKVVDSNHRSHRRQIYSLFPLATRETFHINFYQLDWSWWTDLNPRPADYKSAALPTELHQRFIKSSCLSDLFSIPHTGVFVNRFVRNYCILFFRSIESDTCCRTVSSALDKSG